ncbi:MAG: hypothetical protein WBX22_17160 [Silvibacterium sp.]
MVVRFATALEITTGELLQPSAAQTRLRRKPSLRVLRRLEKIERLPAHPAEHLLKTIDGFLKGRRRVAWPTFTHGDAWNALRPTDSTDSCSQVALQLLPWG